MSNRDGKGNKKNKKYKFSNPNKICPICKSSLDKCGIKGNNHVYHRFCKTCKYTNF